MKRENRTAMVKVKSMDGIIFITHNRSIPAALKNAIDIASRPYGKNVWNGKPAMEISSSISGISGLVQIIK